MTRLHVLLPILAACGTPVLAGPLQVIDLGAGSAYGLNDLGTVVGRTGGNQAFAWTGGLRSEVSGPETFAGRGMDVNAAGDVVGGIHTFSRPQGEPFLLGSSGLDLIGPSGFAGQSNAVNDGGQVVGQYGADRAFVWNGSAAMDLGTLGGARSGAADIDAAGRVVGFSSGANAEARAFLLDPEDTNSDGVADLWFRDDDNDQVNDLMRDLGTLGGPSSVATGMNDLGMVVGNADTATTRNGFLWTEADGMIDLGAEVFPHAINNDGTAVGFYRDGGGQQRAFRGTASGWVDLNTLLPEDSGWVLTEAHAINGNGWIAGAGLLNGSPHAFLMIPEPATLGLLAVGLLVAGRRQAAT